MHNQMMHSAAMEQESPLSHEGAYGTDMWTDMRALSSYQQVATTMAGYGNGYGYIPPITHALPSESLARMAPPPQPMPPVHHQTAPMLMMPTATWPSLLTNPNTYHLQPAAPVAIPPSSAQMKPAKLPTLQTTSQPRKTLTDDDRRRMCQYAEDHPNAKQTDIGQLFGVERSTVSKVLRHREKYLSQEDRNASPLKRVKGGKGGADIEKALLNYVRHAQKSGISVTGEDVKDKARLFSSTMGNSGDAILKGSNSTWLEKFMQKNGISSGKLLRRASETNIPDNIRRLGMTSSTDASPDSPMARNLQSLAGSSPMAATPKTEDDDKNAASANRVGVMADTSPEGGQSGLQQTPTASLPPSAYPDTTASSFSGRSALSPSEPFTFSPDSNMGEFLRPSDLSKPDMEELGPNFQRPRSQTFPTLDVEFVNHQHEARETDPLDVRFDGVPSTTAPSSALESPANEMAVPPTHYATSVVDQPQQPHQHQRHPRSLAASPLQSASPRQAAPQLRHSNSTGSMVSLSSLAAGSRSAASASSPNSPTQDDARRAADTLLSFIQNNVGGFVDQSEFLAVVRLTEKLRLCQQQHQQQHQQLGIGIQGHGLMMGGLSRIPEGDSEMLPNAPPLPQQSAVKMEGTMTA